MKHMAMICVLFAVCNVQTKSKTKTNMNIRAQQQHATDRGRRGAFAPLSPNDSAPSDPSKNTCFVTSKWQSSSARLLEAWIILCRPACDRLHQQPACTKVFQRRRWREQISAAELLRESDMRPTDDSDTLRAACRQCVLEGTSQAVRARSADWQLCRLCCSTWCCFSGTGAAESCAQAYAAAACRRLRTDVCQRSPSCGCETGSCRTSRFAALYCVAPQSG